MPHSLRSASETLKSFGSSRNKGLSNSIAAARLASDGPNDIAEPKRHPILNFARKFWGLSAWMIELIAILSFILHKRADFGIAIALLVVNAVLSFLQEQHASTAVTALRRRLQLSARVLRDGAWTTVSARALVVGDVVRLRSGDFVPADAQVIDGDLGIDQSAITGESAEIRAKPDSNLYSGSVVRDGEATVIVIGTGPHTFYGRTTQLVESAQPKLHIEEVVSRVVRGLLLIVGALVAIAMCVSLLRHIDLLSILPLSLVLLMSAVPVALPVMFTVSMAVGSLDLARKGVLVTRLSAAEDAANLDVLCADKTGTLTLNRLTYVDAIACQGFDKDAVLRNGALASNAANNDAIDIAFLRGAEERKLTNEGATIKSFTPFSPKTRRTEVLVQIRGREFRIEKGALPTLAAHAEVEPGQLESLEDGARDAARKGFRAIAVALAEQDSPLRLVGIALLQDLPRPDSRILIQKLRSLGVRVRMLTGDAVQVAREIAHELGLGEIATVSEMRAAQQSGAAKTTLFPEQYDGFAEVFPEDKFRIVQGLQSAGHVVGMTGDGVNDAPALREAEVGIAVNGATDVAKGAASVVLTTEGLSGIIDLITNGRAIYQRVLTWIINKISRTILKAGFVVAAFLATGQFVISALGMVLIVFMTDFVKIALSTDNVRPSQKPESWNIGPLVKTAVFMGLLMLAEALALLAYGWHRLGLAGNQARLQTFTFQTLLFFAICSIISIRERRFFWASRPSFVLSLALAADMVVGLLIGQFGLAELGRLPLADTGLIVGVAIVSVLGLNDWIKVRSYRLQPAVCSLTFAVE